ncbi:hypothetical protein LPB90_07685 [Chryseobacterium sp. LC2016-29]|uniref:hypothetical protein n=1 Tax=Chryseobacterium sp. LC2016-29 TaxID=2897331 RepID=UPI001E60B381|nr:hypothetical protein [Chryseobacterium sp. LC2016-29]MCD0478334.1 hypothetical protein [Chryseobacterium sp. LC2016-29]
MKKNIFILSMISVISCSGNSESTAGSSNINQESPIENLNVQTTNFSEIDSSGVLMFPLRMGESKRESESSSYKEIPQSEFWNIMFYNSITNNYYLLTKDKILIENFNDDYYNDAETISTNKTNYIFYTARSLDYNKDKLLNYQDPLYLYVSNKKGENFRQLSPNNFNLENWRYIKSTNKIVFSASKDSNKNNLFDDKDEVIAFEVNVDSKELAKEIFSNETKNELKKLYDRDWKKIKK